MMLLSWITWLGYCSVEYNEPTLIYTVGGSCPWWILFSPSLVAHQMEIETVTSLTRWHQNRMARYSDGNHLVLQWKSGWSHMFANTSHGKTRIGAKNWMRNLFIWVVCLSTLLDYRFCNCGRHSTYHRREENNWVCRCVSQQHRTYYRR